jgi:hypothetical protein
MCITPNEAQRLGAAQMRARAREHGNRTAFRSRDVARNVSTTAGTATTASRPNCDFNMISLIHTIPLNHENHFNHMEITVQTNI